MCLDFMGYSCMEFRVGRIFGWVWRTLVEFVVYREVGSRDLGFVMRLRLYRDVIVRGI